MAIMNMSEDSLVSVFMHAGFGALCRMSATSRTALQRLELVTATVAAATREIRVRLSSRMMEVAPRLPRLELVSIIHWQTPVDYYTNNAMAAIPD